MILRKMVEEDILEIAKMMIDAYNNDIWNEAWNIDTAKLYLLDFYNVNKFIGYVIEENEKVIASVFAKEKVWYSGNEIFVEELLVDKCFRQKGYGSILINKLEEYAKNNDLKTIVLATNINSKAPLFYNKHGFKNIDDLRFMYKNIE